MNTTTRIAAALLLVFAPASCGNTIRGVGQDVAGTVDGTQAAGRTVDRAARR